MIRIGVLADTHLSDNSEAGTFLRAVAGRYFAGVELILHAGDIVAPGVLAALAPCPVYGVRGNMDPAAGELPHKRIVTVEGLRIGLIHGWGAPEDLIRRVVGEFAGARLDCLVFGHSHVPLCRREGGMLLFNPGSAGDRRGMAYASVGILEIEEGRVNGRIVALDEALVVKSLSR